MYLLEKERIEVLMMIGFGDRVRSQEEVCNLFNENHPDRPAITRSTVSKIESKFRRYGHVRDLPKGRPPRVSEETVLNVLLETQDNPHAAITTISNNFNLSVGSVHKILKVNKYHPYKIKLVHELLEDDFDRRVQFCEQILEIHNQNVNFTTNIIFSDEATFTLNGHVNRQNCRYWATENPHWMQECHTQRPQKINTWAAIVRNRILGPYFFEGTLNGEGYLNFLQFELIPALAVLFPNPQDPDIPNNEIWFQQDGAPPHFAIAVRQFLDATFPNRWIGRRGPIEWPPRSPDITPLDFFLWGYLKSKVYVNRPNNIDDLKERIRQEIRLISPEVIENVQRETLYRIQKCLEVNGQQIEHQ